MAKKGYIKVRLQSTASAHSYTTTKNTKFAKKLSKKMFDPIVRKHVPYEEKKVAK